MADENQEMLERAINIRMANRSAQAVDDYISAVRMQAAESQQRNLDETRDLRDEIVDLQRRMIEATQQVIANQQALLEQMSDMLEFMQDRLSQPPTVNITQEAQTVRMLQQPVNVDVPQTQVNVSPNIDVPSPSVVIEPAKADMPKRLTVKHSDGTQSTIEIGR